MAIELKVQRPSEKTQVEEQIVFSKGFTLIELLAVIAIVSVLSAVLLGTISHAKGKAKRLSCMNNMRQIGLSSLMYSEDNQDRLPPMEILSNGEPRRGFFAWDMPRVVTSSLQRYGMERDLFYCPAQPGLNRSNAAWEKSRFSRVIGYAFATFGAPKVLGSNIVATTRSRLISLSNGESYSIAPSANLFAADMTVSSGNNARDRSQNNYTQNVGGFASPKYPGWKGLRSAHLSLGNVAGGNGVYADGHVSWKNHPEQELRTVGLAIWW